MTSDEEKKRKNTERARRWQQNNPERYRENQRRWRLNHLDKMREIAKRWRVEHHDRAKEIDRKYRLAHRDVINQRDRIRNHTKKGKDKLAKIELFKLLGSKCSVCGFDKTAALVIHHKNNWKGKSRRRYFMYKWLYYLEEFKKGEQLHLICANCHALIHHNNQNLGTD